VIVAIDIYPLVYLPLNKRIQTKLAVWNVCRASLMSIENALHCKQQYGR